MKKVKNIPLLLSKATALLMFIVFFSITMVQAFHSHTSYANEGNDDTEAIHAAEKCCVCDYMLYKQSRHIPVYTAPVTSTQTAVTVTFPHKPISAIRTLSLHRHGYRGPPVLCFL